MGRSKQTKPTQNIRRNDETEFGRRRIPAEQGDDACIPHPTLNDTDFSYFRTTVENVPIEPFSRRVLEKRNEEQNGFLQDLVDSDEEEEEAKEGEEAEEEASNRDKRQSTCYNVQDLNNQKEDSVDSKVPEVEIVKCKRKKCDTILRVQQEDNADHGMNSIATSRHDGWIVQIFRVEKCAIEIQPNLEQPGMKKGSAVTITPTPGFDSPIIIQSPKVATNILNHYTTKSKSQNVSWESIRPAFQHNLLQMEMEQEKTDPSCENLSVLVRILLTRKAFDDCSPHALPRSVPLKRPRSEKKIDSRHYAAMIQDAFRFLFNSTSLGNLLSSSSCTKAFYHKIGNGNEEKITAKCVYKAVDNIHSHRFEKESSVRLDDRSSSDEIDRGKTYSNLENIPGLVPKLREYQKAAVQWMLERENGQYEDKGWEICWVAIRCFSRNHGGNDLSNPVEAGETDGVLPLYNWKELEGANYLFYNPFTGWLVDSYEGAKVCTVGRGDPVRGGILAESMGLGKTVEVLACILSNRSPTVDSDKLSMTDGKNTPDEIPRTFCNYQLDTRDYLCFCGGNSCNTSSLSWVLCDECNDPMHGQCAGFSDQEELLKHTWQIPGLKSMTNVRLCENKRCPICVAAKHALPGKLIDSCATLIVTPPSILSQWEREIKRHAIQGDVGDETEPKQLLNVKIYHGVKDICQRSQLQAKEGFERRLLNPHFLADADIVLTTFTALMNDLAHSNDNPYIASNGGSEQRASRKRKRYRVVPSPLMSINWWRVALDEAQRVETPTASSAQMALKLISRHRWCISGTPIGRGNIDDLYGLLLFLQAKPFCEKDWFKACIKAQHDDMLERVAHILHESLWRSTKANSTVRIQMGIPEQIEKRIVLKFSSVERHFYQKQLEDTILAADHILSNNKVKRKAKESDILSDQLRKLRAACCHPQVGSSGIGKNRKHHGSNNGINVASGVLTMSQILDKLIDDAKLQAEEAQRIYTLNTNALACLYKLKAESCELNRMFVGEDEIDLLGKSYRAYLDAINVADRNSQPCAVVGESIVSGNNGFEKQGCVVRNGSIRLSWIFFSKGDDDESSCLWARFDFSGSIKKICSVALRPMNDVPKDYVSLYPRECCLQVSNPALGGLFVNSLTFTLPHPNETEAGNNVDWCQFESLQPHKSKCWRILIQSFYPSDISNSINKNFFVGFHVQLMEPEIIPDSLQRLHMLHNGILTLTTLREKGVRIDANTNENFSMKGDSLDDSMSITIKNMEREKDSLESHYVEAARVLQLASNTRLRDLSIKRKVLQRELLDESGGHSKLPFQPWWQDLLAWCHMHPTPRNQVSLADFTEDSLFQLFNDPSQTFNRRSFPFVETVEGLHIALTIKMQDNSFFENILDNTIFNCIESIAGLSDHPSDSDIYENSHCRKCRSDWDQKGPVCKCCKLEEQLLKHENNFKDSEINAILHSMSEWIKSMLDKNRRSSNKSMEKQLVELSKRADKFFEFRDIVQKELEYAKAKWKTHLNLLSDIDELNQCKRTMRLAFDENISNLTAHERAFLVNPCDIPILIMDHTAKQAMAEGNLRRLKDLLRFLKNQNQDQQVTAQDQEDGKIVCCICLCPFHKEKAVLRCGHAYHYDPCVQKLLVRSSGTIVCPMRCPIRTKKEDILIASDFSKDDGSKVLKEIEGQWGTKVDRLISDLLEVVEAGEKSVVFSQWDDMLAIMEHALTANSIHYVRPASIKKFGAAMRYFRTSNCHVLLLNIKHGAEGLTLVEANHVFMIEPLLNHSMDAQAINRIHRIGQTSKTYIHRYIIEDTIEVNIDRLRVERQCHDGEEEDFAMKKNQTLSAGGLDGGFDENELKTLLK